jgi:transcriptional regulator with XRE-family HTH domain
VSKAYKERIQFIREWRLKRGLSLRGLAARMETPGGEELISHASLSRYETGEQECSVTMLAAIAEALNVRPWTLLAMHPDKGGEAINLLANLPPDRQRQAAAIIKALAEA